MNELDMDIMQNDFANLAEEMGFDLEHYDSDSAQEECLNQLLRDAVKYIKAQKMQLGRLYLEI